jgi:hypothetical protein
MWVAGIEVRGGIIRREDEQGFQEADDGLLPPLRELGKGIARRLCLPAVAQTHFPQIHPAAVVAVGRRIAHSP